jgi:hypothetical protein
MPFGKHHIDPAQTEAMRSAFHKLCDTLRLRCDGDDPMTEFIVTKIVALAKAGEHDASRLVELVLNDVADSGLPTRLEAASEFAGGGGFVPLRPRFMRSRGNALTV